MTVTVTPTVQVDNHPPRVRLDVTASAGETEATVTRLDPDGRTRTVRTTDGNPLTISAGLGLVYDYEAPFGSPVSYSTLESPSTVADAVTVDVDEVWLIHIGVPDLSMPITVASFGSRTRRVVQSVFRPLGGEFPVVHTDGARKAPDSVLDVRTETESERASLEAVTWDAGVLLLNVPAGLGWGVPTCYIAVGDMEESRLYDYAAEPRRYVSLPYQVVDRPEGGTQAERTYADVVADYSTYADVMTAYSTYFDLLAGP